MNIGFFDSGVGGATIFKEAIKEINEEFYYFADNKNAPYGVKEITEVKRFSLNAVELLIKKGCKIIVVACNTATSVAINEMREKYPDIIFIGTEPAIKLAKDAISKKRVLVVATSITIKGEKLSMLVDKLSMNECIDTLALDKLVEFAEKGNVDGEEVCLYLKSKLNHLDLNNYSHIVLGCTHFPLFKSNFKEVIPRDIVLLDSCKGVISNLKNNLNDNISNTNNSKINLILSKQDAHFVENFKGIIENKNVNIEVI